MRLTTSLNPLRFMMLAALTALVALTSAAQTLPQVKVDFSMGNRQDDQVVEPGFTAWKVQQGRFDTLTIDGLRFTLGLAIDAPCELQASWNKTAILNADNREQNGRLTFDGLTLVPRIAGLFTLRIEGLPQGRHVLRTYHNCWENPDAFRAAPLSVKCNGHRVYEDVDITFAQAVAANTTLLSIPFTVDNDGDAVEVDFYTSDEDDLPTGNAKTLFAAPLLCGFELNTPDISRQAKAPFPANGDTHANADGGTCQLSWGNPSVGSAGCRLYVATSPEALATAVPIATLGATDTTYTMTGLYSGNTYYWRVDELFAPSGFPGGEPVVTEGQVWTFQPRQLAFPGAEGYGRFAHGGRGGTVYHVTNLHHDHEPGSLLYGLVDVEDPHTIVFDVSGTIVMDFGHIFSRPDITIAGQTAPGKGICLKAANVNIGSDNICRFIRFKRGYGPTGNAMGMTGADNTIVDHCTAVWGTDETVSGRGAKNISFQYCLIAEALGIADHKNYPPGTNHGYAATIDGNTGSWHHNLLANCEGRNWSMGGGMDGTNTAIGKMDIFNNVVYNWHHRTTDGNCHEVNFVGNYYKMGPDTRRTILFTQQYENAGSRQSTWRAYINGNIRENQDHTLTTDQKDDTYNVQLSHGDPGPTYPSVVDQPFFPSFAQIHTAQDALKIVTSTAGATMPMPDDQHRRVVGETIDGTFTFTGSRSGIRGEIDHEDDCGGWEDYPVMTRPADWDTDQDGMPDWYERLIGSNTAVANNNDDPDHDGWTLLEDYLELMAHPYVVVKPSGAATIDIAQFFRGFTNRPVFSVGNTAKQFCKVTVNGSTVKVKARKQTSICPITMTVRDADGTTYSQRLTIIITNDEIQ